MPITQCRQLQEEIVRVAVDEMHQLETQVLTGRSMRTISRAVAY